MPKAKKVIELELAEHVVELDDGGCAKIVHCDGDGTEEESGMFVRLHSWSDSKNHSELDQFVGKRVRITVEEI